MGYIVAKFGGTSVAELTAIKQCVKVITRESTIRLVVVSAPAGVTNRLEDIATNQLRKHEIPVELEAIDTQLRAIADGLSLRDEPKFQLLLDDMKQYALNSDFCEPSNQDKLLAYGELFSSLFMAQALRNEGIQSLNFDIRQVMATDSHFRAAKPNLTKLLNNVTRNLVPLLNDNVVVTQGFIGSNANGDTTTLGRGGSDYTASLLAEAIGAMRCEIWTDVPGVFSTDPRLVQDAFPLPELSYDEAAELANFGAKVLHPESLAPTLRSNIPVFVGATKAPEKGGTTLVKDCLEEPSFRAITRRREQDLVTLKTPARYRSSQFIGEVFKIVDSHGLSIDLITTSELSISLTFNDPSNSQWSSVNQKVIAALQQICDVTVDENLDLITVVGNHLHERLGTTATLFSMLSKFKVRLISFGANPHNISFLVGKDDSEEVINILHESLFQSKN